MRTLAVDTEDTGLYLHHGCRPFFISTCCNRGKTKHWEWEVDVKTREVQIPDDEVDDITEYINSFDQIVLHNAKFDWHALSLSGVKMPPWSRIHDTLLMSHCLDSAEPHGLKDLAAKYLDIPDDDQQNLKKVVDKARRIGKKLGWMIASPDCPHLRPCNGKAPKSGWWVLDMWLPRAIVLYAPNELTPAELKLWPKVCGIYAETDAVRTIGLFNLFSEQLEEEGLWDQYEFQRSNLPSTAWMERRGVSIREKEVKDADKRIRIEATHHTESAIQIASEYLGNNNLNLNSSKQLQALLYDSFRLPVIKRTDGGSPSCDFDTLLRLAFMAGEGADGDAATFLRHLVHRNKLNKTLEFLKKYQANLHQGRIYPTFNLTGTSTTRMSSESPNAQNVGKGGAASGIDDPELQAFLEEVSKDNTSLRSIFGPRKGRVWYSLDYAQLQLRIFAFVSGEKDLIKAFDEGWDAHDYIAHRIFRLKDGQKPDKLQRRIGKCFHPDTEVLTREGWKKIEDVTTDQEIVQAHPMTGGGVSLSWVKPLEVFTKPNDFDHLIHLKNEGIDIRVTPDHRMLAWEGGKKKRPKVITPSDVNNCRTWANAGMLEDTNLTAPTIRESMLRLAVATQADGSYASKMIRFGFTKQRKIARLTNLLAAADVPYRTRISSQGATEFIINTENAKPIRELLDLDKTMPWRWVSFSKNLREVILDESQFWDASKAKNWNAFRYLSVLQKNIDVLQAIASITNRKTRYNNSQSCTQLTIRDKHNSRGGNVAAVKVRSPKYVSCLSVPSTFVLVRDRGIPVITGQSINFGFIFGASPAKIEATAGRPGIYDEVTSMFPNAHRFMEATKRQVRQKGYVIVPGGYKLMCDQTHKGVNYIVQGSEGLIVKRAMVDCRRYLLKNCPQGYMTLQVHDELVFDMPNSDHSVMLRRADYYDKWGHYRFGQWEHLKAIADIMAAAGDYYGMRTPVEAEIVQTSWDKGIKVK